MTKAFSILMLGLLMVAGMASVTVAGSHGRETAPSFAPDQAHACCGHKIQRPSAASPVADLETQAPTEGECCPGGCGSSCGSCGVCGAKSLTANATGVRGHHRPDAADVVLVAADELIAAGHLSSMERPPRA